jgi:hypothetical protein
LWSRETPDAEAWGTSSTTSGLVLIVTLLTLCTKLFGLDEVKALLQGVVASTTDDAEGVLEGAGLGAARQ